MKRSRRIGSLASAGLVLLLLSGCEDGGEDSANGAIPSGSISGRVTTLSNQPLVGAEILAYGAEESIWGDISDADGHYVIAGLPDGEYQLICSLQGFASDSNTTAVAMGQETADQDLVLDALPFVEDLQVASHLYCQQILPPFIYTLSAQAQISDQDGFYDIAGAQLNLEGEYLATMIHDSAIGDLLGYSIIVPEDSLPGQSIAAVMGKIFTCSVFDMSNNFAVSSPEMIRRCFEEVPYPISPNFNETVYVPNPWLIWNPFDAPFLFTYTAQVYRDIGRIQFYWQQSAMPMDQDSVQVDSLPNGYYFWTLLTVDEYGNSAQSQPAYFYVDHLP